MSWQLKVRKFDDDAALVLKVAVTDDLPAVLGALRFSGYQHFELSSLCGDDAEL